MTLELLQEFAELAKCLNFSTAANNLYMTQPVLSRHISNLENELGSQLLIRNTRSVQLTESGRIFLTSCNSILNQYSEAKQRLGLARENIIGVLNIGFIDRLVHAYLPDFLFHFGQSHEQLHMEYFATDISHIVELLESDKLDIAFMPGTYIASGDVYEVMPVVKNQLSILCPAAHPLADREELTFADISGVPFIGLSSNIDPWSYTMYNSIFIENKAEYNLVREAPNVTTATYYMLHQNYLMVIPEIAARDIASKYITVKPLSGINPVTSINMLYKKSNDNSLIPVFINSFFDFFAMPEHQDLPSCISDFNFNRDSSLL